MLCCRGFPSTLWAKDEYFVQLFIIFWIWFLKTVIKYPLISLEVFTFYESYFQSQRSFLGRWQRSLIHYDDVIMGTIASQITSLTIVYPTVIQTQIKENIKAARHWPLCGPRWIPRTNGQLRGGNVSIWWPHHVLCMLIICTETSIIHQWYVSREQAVRLVIYYILPIHRGWT